MILLLACTQPEPTSPSDPPDSAPIADTVDTDAETLPGDTDTGPPPCADLPAVTLNEVVAANIEGLTDADGDTSDWIELSTLDPVDLDGWALAESDAGGWVFPAYTLNPGDTPVVFASGKDRRDVAELHTDFALDSEDAEVWLLGPDGCIADHLELGRMYADTAYGRALDGTLGYFQEPTPGAPNTTESRPGYAPTPTLSPAGGLYEDVTVTVTGEGTLTVTDDSSVPTESSAAYTGPIEVDGIRVVRARAFEDGLWPSPIATATYFEDDTGFATGLMVISLVSDPPDLWDEDTGIYAYGTDYESTYPYFGANFWEPWERDVHVEIWDPDGTPRIAQDAGIQIAGGYSRSFDQRNFELLARGGYGPDTFASPLFHQEEIQEYRHLYLRNGGDWCGTQIIDASVQGVFRDPDGRRSDAVDAQAYEPVLVYLDGEFWGLYELKERLDEYWIAAHRDEGPDDLDRVRLGWTHEANWSLDQGDWVAWDELQALWQTRDLSDPDAWTEFESQVDLENFASSVVVQGWIANTDWWVNNLRMWRPHRDDGRWRWMSYDFGHGWGYANYDHLSTSVVTNADGLPIAAALANPAFEQLFLDTHADYLNTTLRGDYAAEVVTGLADDVRPAMAMQRERWCGGAAMDSWEASIEYAVSYASERATAMDKQLGVVFEATSRPILELDADPQDAGRFDLTVVSVTPPFAGRYFEGVPVTVTAVPAEGYTFAGWSDPELGTEPTVTVPMDGDTLLLALFDPA